MKEIFNAFSPLLNYRLNIFNNMIPVSGILTAVILLSITGSIINSILGGDGKND